MDKNPLESPEFILARYEVDVIAFLSSAHVETGRVDHKLVNERIVVAVHNGAERVYGKDVVMATAIAEIMIKRLLSGVGISDDTRASIIKSSIKDAARWASEHFATRHFWIFSRPMRPRWLLETIVRSEVSLRS